MRSGDAVFPGRQWLGTRWTRNPVGRGEFTWTRREVPEFAPQWSSTRLHTYLGELIQQGLVAKVSGKKKCPEPYRGTAKTGMVGASWWGYGRERSGDIPRAFWGCSGGHVPVANHCLRTPLGSGTPGDDENTKGSRTNTVEVPPAAVS